MRAAQICQYGSVEQLVIRQVALPEPGPRDLRVRVHASSVNPVDCKIRSGTHRAVLRYRLPWTLGLDVSGVVDAVGAQVKRFKPGDEVFASADHRRPGCYAEYVLVDESIAAAKPRRFDHEEAAALPLAGLTAWQSLIGRAHLAPGDRVLVHAGAGGVGSLAIQLAKARGAWVAATCSAPNRPLVLGLGADQAIDYRAEPFERQISGLDVVFDCVGGETRKRSLKVLRRGGRLVSIVQDLSELVRRYGPALGMVGAGLEMAQGMLWPRLRAGVKATWVLQKPNATQLAELASMVDRGQIQSVIDSVFDLEQIQGAQRRSETGRARGKIVVRVAH